MSIPEYPTLYIFKNKKVYQWSIKIEKDGDIFYSAIWLLK
jgi:hypothetical protein